MDIPAQLKRFLPSDVGSAFSLENVDAPLGKRLFAWWEGCSVADISNRTIDPDNDDISEDNDGFDEDEEPVLPVARSVHTEDYGDDEDDGEDDGPFWNTKRIAVTEKLWGVGTTTPGGVERTLYMMVAFGLGKEVNVLNIGPGLGGDALQIAKKYDSWVTSYEQDSELAAVAIARAEQAGLSKKAQFHHTAYSEIDLRNEIFDCAFSRDVLFTVEDRDDLLMTVMESLKPQCPLLFTDYFVTEGREDDPTIRDWIEAETATVNPWSVAEAEEALRQSNFELRVVEDISETVRKDIFAGWSGFVEESEGPGIHPQLLKTVVQIAELWGRRVAALDSGALTMHRIVALKI